MSIAEMPLTTRSESAMRDSHYWKEHYVVESSAEEIERNLKKVHFASTGKRFELIYFEKSTGAPNILISQGSGGHAYIFAELAYLLHLHGYNVFVMPKHGGLTINELVTRHNDAIAYISAKFNNRVAAFAEGLGCYAVFYFALAEAPVRSLALLNGPAILSEDKFQRAILGGTGPAAKRRKRLLPFVRSLAKLFPRLRMRISTYLDFEEMIDTKEENRRIEEAFVNSFSKDPDFDRSYPLRAIMSLVSTPPPNDLSELSIPTMFIVPVRGFFPAYFKDLYSRLPRIKKRLIEVDGGVFWMLSHPKEAAGIISEWFAETI